MISRILKLEEGVGCEFGLSKWMTVDKDMIASFSQTTAHALGVPNADTPSQSEVADSFLILSLLSHMFANAVPSSETGQGAINYGFDKVRFVAPVKAGASIRGRFTLAKYSQPQPGVIETTWNVTVEIKGEEQPALLAHWKNLRISKDKASLERAS